MAAAADLSLTGLAKSDAALKDHKEFQVLLKKEGYGLPASNEAVDRAAKALNEKKFKATVVADKAAALELVKTLIPQNAKFGMAGSTTGDEIGLVDYLKTRKDLTNYRVMSTEAMAKQDWTGVGAARVGATVAEVFFTSISAVSETGEMVWADLTGTRTGPVLGAKQVICVIGANKIVPTAAEAVERLKNFCLPAESARVRVVYKVPASAINNQLVVSAADPWGAPGRIHVIIVKGATLGF
jgi:hypothetical protein